MFSKKNYIPFKNMFPFLLKYISVHKRDGESHLMAMLKLICAKKYFIVLSDVWSKKKRKRKRPTGTNGKYFL